jgi:hypothetical protein
MLKLLFPNAVMTHEVIPPLPQATASSFLHRSHDILKLVLIRITHKHSVIRLILLRGQADVIFQVEGSAVLLALDWLEVEQQILLDRAHRVRLEIRVVAWVQLRRHAHIVVVRDHHVDVCGAVRVAAHHLEDVGARPARVDGVLGGLEAVEVEGAVGVGAELAPQVVPRLVLRVEDVVFAVRARLPHVEHRVGDPRACVYVLDHPVEVRQLPVLGHVLHDGGAQLAEGRLR